MYFQGNSFELPYYQYMTLCMCIEIKAIFNTANFLPMKTMGTGTYKVPAGKTCTVNEKGL